VLKWDWKSSQGVDNDKKFLEARSTAGTDSFKPVNLESIEP